MSLKKPSYKELEEKIKKLEKQLAQKSKDTHSFLNENISNDFDNQKEVLIDNSFPIPEDVKENEISNIFQSVYEQLPIGIAIFDANTGQFYEINPKYAEITGCTQKEILGNYYQNLTHPQDIEEELKLMQLLADGKKQSFSIDKRYKRPDGKTVWGNVTVFPVKEENQLVRKNIAIIIDITKRKNAEERIRKNEDRYRTIFNFSALPIWEEDFSEIKKVINNIVNSGVIDIRKYFDDHMEEVKHLATLVKIVDMNHQSIGFTGYKSKKEINKNLSFYFFEESYDIFKEELIALAEGKTKFTSELPIKTKYGNIKYVSLHLLVTPGYEHDLSKILVSFVDITAQKKANELIKDSEEKFSKAFNNSPSLNAIISKETFDFIEVNDYFLKISGFTKEEVLKMKATDPKLVYNNNEFGKAFDIYKKEKKLKNFEVIFKTKEGQHRYGLLSLDDIQIKNEIFFLGVMNDITERKLAEEALIESEDRYHQLVELSPDSILIHQDFKIIFANSAFAKLLGQKTPKELFGKNIVDYLHPHSFDILNERFKHVAKNKLINNITEQNFVRYDGKEFFLEINSIVMEIEGQKAIFSILRDITDKKKAEEKLKKSEEKFTAIIMNSSSVAIEIIDTKGIILYWNPAASKLYEVNEKVIVGEAFKKILHPKTDMQHPLLLKGNEEMPEFNEPLEWKLKFKDGNYKYIYSTIFKLRDANYNFQYVCMDIDITKQKILEKTVFHATVDAGEKERERIAKDLHDELGPLLSTVKLFLYTIAEDMPQIVDNQLYKRTIATIEQSISSVKNISNNISPHILKDFGLVQAIKSYIDNILPAKKIKICFNANLVRRLNTTIETALYRIICELINNTIKHAQASKIELSIKDATNNLNIVYTDNGKGFDVTNAFKSPKGMGLINLRNRIKNIEGNIEIISKPYEETKTEINIDISRFNYEY